MLIQVSYNDETFDYVKDFMLDALIESGSITKFRRSDGWVEVGSARVRQAQPEGGYNGVERRGADRRKRDRGGYDRRALVKLAVGRPAERSSELPN